MNSKLSLKTTAVVAAVICAVLFFAFNNHFLSSAKKGSTRLTPDSAQNIKLDEKPYLSDEDAIKSDEDSKSFVKFQNGKILKTSDFASVAADQGIDFAQVQAVSAATDARASTSASSPASS